MSWNDFNASPASLLLSSSDDGGTTWSAPVTVHSGSPFVRDVQITVGPNGTVLLAGMDEGGGGFNPRTNLMYRSANGGATWTQYGMGASFAVRVATPTGVS